MNRKWLAGVLAAVAAAAFGGVDWKSDPVQSGKGHRFAVADYSGHKVCIVGTDGKVEWEYPTGTVNDIWMLPNGNLLFNTGTGVQEVTPEKEVVFEYKSKGEVYACQRLPNGNTFIGECSDGNLIEVDPSGKIVKKIELLAHLPEPAAGKGKKKPKGKGGHAFMRNARKLPNGNYLVALYGGKKVVEYDPDGTVLREIPASGCPHSAVRLPNGNTLIACGDKDTKNKVMEVDPAGKVVWKLDQDELPGITLYFATGLQRLPNGNTVLTNWLGHGKARKSAHIIEVTPEKQVVWTYQDFDALVTASSIQLLDVPGDAVQGEIWH
ncbi:hypothetical protein PDESU_02421 [Pontiella desulfatans]|uniref:Outer membrane protein assembly factor BamB n=1 Tax=Pontiella desulfatans TaxID=2750659 RepID=A0A6C2U2I3_PONDE|nr:hypothetical protein [Pontiella desulfatans]VGO13864.1 hypothetical protein PDESU_02421 [Pontiella desulfatans]